MKILRYHINLDRVGITASTLCAIHCAAIPFLITILPIWGLDFLANEWMEIFIIVISLILGIWSLTTSFKKTHYNILPISLFVTGFALIVMGHFLNIDFLEPILIPFGGFTIALAHLINLRLLKSCPTNHKH